MAPSRSVDVELIAETMAPGAVVAPHQRPDKRRELVTRPAWASASMARGARGPQGEHRELVTRLAGH